MRALAKPKPKGARGDDLIGLASVGAANMIVDPATRELYVADGYVNHRVIVFDADTGII